jgi:hypothetical protein
MNIRKASAIYSLLIGFSILLIWLILFFGGGDEEMVISLETTPIEMGAHIAAELITAAVLITAGLGLLKGRDWSKTLFFFGTGLLTYSVISAAGFYGQRGDYVPAGVFAGILALGVLFTFLAWKNPDFTEGEGV